MGVVVDEGVPMTARDGVVLVADVYRPDGDGRWPTLLHRTPYDRRDPTLVAAIVADPLWLARQGFAVVVQDVRGRFGSGGRLDFAHQEADDGFDAVEWAAAQPFSDGRVGIYGSSYHAITTYGALAARPPHLRAALAMIGATAMGPTTHPGGTFELGFLTLYALAQSLDAVRRPDVPAAERADLTARIAAALSRPAETVATLPLTDVDVLSDPRVAPYWTEWLTGARPDRPVAPPDVPLLQVAAYRDFMAPTMFALARTLAGDGRHRLVAGPWPHGGVYTGHTGARVLPGTPGGVGTWGPLVAAWFDVHLRDGDGAAYPSAARWLGGEPVRYHVGGENRWASAPSWPPPGTATTTWHPTSATGARSAMGDGHLTPATPGGVPPHHDGAGGDPGRAGAEGSAGSVGPAGSVGSEGSARAEKSAGAAGAAGGVGTDTWAADPHDPFPTCGGAFAAGALGPDGIQDQRAVDHRDDVLVYTSAPLEAPVTVAGAPELVVALTSTAPDADVCVTLVDVEPDGFALPVAEGAQRARYRPGLEKPAGRGSPSPDAAHAAAGATSGDGEPGGPAQGGGESGGGESGGTASSWLRPDVPAEVRVALHDTAHTFRTDHRIRIMVAGACYPRRSRNLHTTTVPELGTLDEAVVAHHTLHHDGSRLILPVLMAD